MTYKWKAFCPECDSKNDGYTGVSDSTAVPEDGDISICAYCGTISKFAIANDVVKLERASDEEMKHLMENPDIRRALASLRAVGASN